MHCIRAASSIRRSLAAPDLEQASLDFELNALESEGFLGLKIENWSAQYPAESFRLED